MERDIYQKTLERQIREGEVRLSCQGCGEDEPSLIEWHHPLGRANSDEKIPLCKNCHAKITNDQNKISPQSRSSCTSPEKKRGFILVSLGSLLELIGRHLKNLGHEEIDNE